MGRDNRGIINLGHKVYWSIGREANSEKCLSTLKLVKETYMNIVYAPGTFICASIFLYLPILFLFSI